MNQQTQQIPLFTNAKLEPIQQKEETKETENQSSLPVLKTTSSQEKSVQGSSKLKPANKISLFDSDDEDDDFLSDSKTTNASIADAKKVAQFDSSKSFPAIPSKVENDANKTCN